VEASVAGLLTETLSFAPGETIQVFAVPVSDNNVDNPDEVHTLVLSNPVGATLGIPAGATLTILDDDPAGTYLYLPVIFRNHTP